MTTKDMTDEIVKYLGTRFTGYEVHQPLTTFIDNTRTEKTKVGGVTIASVTVGNQIKARGSVEVGGLISHEGSLVKMEVGAFTLWVTDPFLKLTFSYSSATHGERWVWPGGAKVDNVWDSVHPAGTITGVLHMLPQQNGMLVLEVTVKPGNDDRPNNFIKERVAPLTMGKFDSLIENFTGVSVNPG